MKSYLVQVTLGQHFEDLGVIAASPEAAVAAARDLVAKTPALAMFKHRYARFSV